MDRREGGAVDGGREGEEEVDPNREEQGIVVTFAFDLKVSSMFCILGGCGINWFSTSINVW